MAVRSDHNLNARYMAALSHFSTAADWRAYLTLAEEFRALDAYKDSARLYDRCVKAASAPAYRAVREKLDSRDEKTVEDYREAACILSMIPDYADARELMRVCNVRANVLLYDRAVALVTNSDATTDEIGQAVQIFREIKSFRNSRELLERYEKYYCERVYAEASEIARTGHVYSEFDEAYELFSRIPQYADSREMASACQKRADKLRPRTRRTRAHGGDARPKRGEPGKRHTTGNSDETVKVRNAWSGKPTKSADEISNGFTEIWRIVDKRYLTACLLWFAAFLADVAASVWIAKSQISWVKAHLNELRSVVILTAIVSGFFCVRCLLRMLTRSMRRRIAASMAALVRKLTLPLVRLTEKLLASVGIELHRCNRLGGRDERSIVIEPDRPKRVRRRLKNELKWSEQTDNVSRVRFLFIDYMLLRIRQGYFFRRSATPREISCEIALEEDERELFLAYQKARYAGSLSEDELSGEAIGRMRALNERVRSRRPKHEQS